MITGAKGMLAQAVRKKFVTGLDGSKNELFLTDVVADAELGSRSLDITDFEAVRAVLSDVKPDLVINCAAYTNVDGAEQAEALAEKVNALGPENLAKAAAETETVSGKKGVVLVHISTDYVFGGNKPVQKTEAELVESPEKFIYSEDDSKEPKSVYGKTKLKGEEAIEQNCDKFYIFRTAWLYGMGGKNFVQTMLTVGRKQAEDAQNGEAEVSVVDDQHGSPTYTEDLTDIIYQAVYKQIPFGIYNATNEGFTTWADFTREIYRQAGVDCKVKGISSEEYEVQAEQKAAERGEKRIVAPRPKNSQMSKAKLTEAGVVVPEWQDALKRYLTEVETSKQE